MFRIRRICMIIAGTQNGQRGHVTVLREDCAAVFKGQNVVRPCQQLPILPERFQCPLPRGGVAEAGLDADVQRLLKFYRAGDFRCAENCGSVPGFAAEAEKAAAQLR